VGRGGLYRLTSPGGLLWREWDGETVVFNPASGNTHRLPAAAAEMLRALTARPSTSAELVADLAALLPEQRDELGTWVSALLDEFERAGLVERR
jgi:PqqD family protein of HPr-rel-A system